VTLHHIPVLRLLQGPGPGQPVLAQLLQADGADKSVTVVRENVLLPDICRGQPKPTPGTRAAVRRLRARKLGTTSTSLLSSSGSEDDREQAPQLIPHVPERLQFLLLGSVGAGGVG